VQTAEVGMAVIILNIERWKSGVTVGLEISVAAVKIIIQNVKYLYGAPTTYTFNLPLDGSSY
jgi:hypothetical protein